MVFIHIRSRNSMKYDQGNKTTISCETKGVTLSKMYKKL